MKCTEEGCTKEAVRRTFCKSHYVKRIYRQRPEVRQKSYERARSPRQRYVASRSAAKRAGIEFHLTFEEYAAIIERPCHYCGNPRVSATGRGMDRVDNSKGYSVDNVLPCCPPCNLFRGDTYTVEEAKAAINAIAQLRMNQGRSPYMEQSAWTRGMARQFD